MEHGLILSHNISTVIAVIFAFVYCVINIKNIFITRVKKGLIIDIIFILLITSFFWMPFFETKFYTEYRVYEENAMVTKESFLSHTLDLKDLFITKNDSIFVFEVGLPVILMLAFSIMTFRRLEENKKEYVFFLISGIVSIWMATKYFPWKLLPDSTLIMQFPWRMLAFSSFFFAIVSSINMSIVIKKFNVKDVAIISIICIIYIYSRHYVIQYSDNITDVEQYSISTISGQDNECLAGMGRLEYLPSKAYENTFYIATRKSGIIAITGSCQIQNELEIGSYMTAKIITEDEKAELELPFIYYPGYTVRLDGMILDTFETENGFLGCYIESNDDGKLEVKYTGTNLMNITKILSLITTVIFAVYVWKKH